MKIHLGKFSNYHCGGTAFYSDENIPEEAERKRPFKCEICGKGYARPVLLRDHMRIQHSGEFKKLALRTSAFREQHMNSLCAMKVAIYGNIFRRQCF